MSENFERTFRSMAKEQTRALRFTESQLETALRNLENQAHDLRARLAANQPMDSGWLRQPTFDATKLIAERETSILAMLRLQALATTYGIELPDEEWE